jgi:hypothetical protein
MSMVGDGDFDQDDLRHLDADGDGNVYDEDRDALVVDGDGDFDAADVKKLDSDGECDFDASDLKKLKGKKKQKGDQDGDGEQFDTDGENSDHTAGHDCLRNQHENTPFEF